METQKNAAGSPATANASSQENLDFLVDRGMRVNFMLPPPLRFVCAVHFTSVQCTDYIKVNYKKWYTVRMSATRQLNQAGIAAAALAIADAEGFAAVSMRRIAQELGVGTMSLYYYAKSKAELISAMDDALMAEVLVPTLPEDWREALTAIASRTRDVFLRHPWALSSMQSAPPGENAMHHMEQCLQALAKTSMTTEEKLTLLALVDDFVFGYTLRETAGDPVVDID